MDTRGEKREQVPVSSHMMTVSTVWPVPTNGVHSSSLWSPPTHTCCSCLQLDVCIHDRLGEGGLAVVPSYLYVPREEGWGNKAAFHVDDITGLLVLWQ